VKNLARTEIDIDARENRFSGEAVRSRSRILIRLSNYINTVESAVVSRTSVGWISVKCNEQFTRVHIHNRTQRKIRKKRSRERRKAHHLELARRMLAGHERRCLLQSSISIQRSQGLIIMRHKHMTQRLGIPARRGLDFPGKRVKLKARASFSSTATLNQLTPIINC